MVLRLRANRRGNPLLYFRGGQDSIDNHVPLYFGGGFSGVVMDINDGSRVDYSTHNKHPYANGPTGSAGMQDIGEKKWEHTRFLIQPRYLLCSLLPLH